MQRWLVVSLSVFILTWIALVAATSYLQVSGTFDSHGKQSTTFGSGSNTSSYIEVPSDDVIEVAGDKIVRDLSHVLGDVHASAAQDPSADGIVVDSANPSMREGLKAWMKEVRQAPNNGILTDDIPRQLDVFETRRVKVSIASIQAGKNVIRELGIDDPKAHNILVSRYISVNIFGNKEDWDIERISHEIQFFDDVQVWEFLITPLKGGKSILEIRISLYNEPAFYPIRKQSKEVEVYVPIISSLKIASRDYGLNQLASTLLFPTIVSVLGAVLAGAWTRRRDSEVAKPPKTGDDPPPSVPLLAKDNVTKQDAPPEESPHTDS